MRSCNVVVDVWLYATSEVTTVRATVNSSDSSDSDESALLESACRTTVSQEESFEMDCTSNVSYSNHEAADHTESACANSMPVHTDNDIDVLEAVLKAMKLNDDVGGSQANFLNILEFGREMYYKNQAQPSDRNLWPCSWQEALRMLEKSGYNEPQDLYICLDSAHPCSYDAMKSPDESCKYCKKKVFDSIKYSYLPLRNKILQWCQDADFLCQDDCPLERKGPLDE